ncbi:MAG: N-acetylmuramoyl-L-alanine amidase [Alphaproteobacteria bacterium]|nr:N-acetylmuramoyl-L-alanine amidase [Alphaproteobacteria bacterium]
MKSPSLLKLIAALILCTVFLIPTKTHALTIKDVRFGHYPDKTRLVIDLDEDAKFRTFVIGDPYRMVIDLPSFAWKTATVKDQQASGITAVRHGNLKPGISRIVFDLNRPISIHSAFTLPASQGKPPRLVIDFANTNTAGFAMAQNDIRGTLDINKGTELSAAPPPRTPSTKPQLTDKKPLVIIDPGHGGVDPGAIGPNGIHEKNVVLALGLELKKQLEESGQYRVKMTRYDDTFIQLSNRVKYARKHNGDLFVSIHADSLRDNKVSGASFYTLSEKASDAQAAKLAARENKADLIAGIELEVEDEAVMDILIDLARRNTQNQSKYFANILIGKFKGNKLKLLRSANRHANFAVLKAPDIPSVLVETGFMSNVEEATKLNSPAHRQRIAGSLKKGIDAYFKTVKENERS